MRHEIVADQQFAVPVEPPFRAVRVQQVGKVPLAFPLALVVASETGRVNALPRGLHLDVSGDGTSHAHPVIRANLALCVSHLIVEDSADSQLLACRGQQSL